MSLRSCFLSSICLASLTGVAAASPVILNEVNGVNTTMSLDGGNSDVHFGIVPGNGGDWFELVVVGDGSAGGTWDLRNYSIEVKDTGATAKIKLSADSAWSAVQNGTILTFIARNTANGGLDTDLTIPDHFATDGYAWKNIWIGDAALIDQGASTGYAIVGGIVTGIPTSHNNTNVTILDATNVANFGPAGEGAPGYPGGGINQSEIMKLEADPTTSIVSSSPYNDGTSSSFGAPNLWSSGANRQSFAAFQVVPEPCSALLAAASGATLILCSRRARR